MLPNYTPHPSPQFHAENFGFEEIDHIAIACQAGTTSSIIDWYSRSFRFNRIVISGQEDKDKGLEIFGKKSGLRIKTIMSSKDNQTKSTKLFGVNLVFVEPINVDEPGQVATVGNFLIDRPKKKKQRNEARGKKNGIPEKTKQNFQFLRHHSGPGVQHVALYTNAIIDTVKKIKGRNVATISVPPNYYEMMFEIVPISHEIRKCYSKDLRELSILFDFQQDPETKKFMFEKYLLQTFTDSMCDRKTYFLEIIQRHQTDGFGHRNITALFKCVEELHKNHQ